MSSFDNVMRIQYLSIHGQAGASNPNPTPNPPHSSRAIIILLFDPIIMDGLTNGPTDKASYRVASPRLKIQIQQGWINGNPVADCWAGAVM